MEVEETKLPGVGLRHDFITETGKRIGVISTKNGTRQVAIYRADDEDCVKAAIDLNAEEASVLAELLGAPKVIERLARLSEQVEGIKTAGIPLGTASPYINRTLGEAEIRSRTGVSIVAVYRDGEVTPSPTPAFRFQAGDKVIVVGTEDGVRAASEILEA
jgi:TrkA domain protein